MAVNETPPFWFEKAGLKAWALAPFAYLYGRAAARRMHGRAAGSVAVPVLCIGNFVAGGGGKTPTALALAKALETRGYKPGFLSRGYGGRIQGPEVVDYKRHRALDCGDEPLLLARQGLTVVSAERVSGANLLVEQGADFILMDDGFQNPRLRRDFNLVAVDSRRGIGNGLAMPAGPLRVGLRDQLLLADAILVIGGEPGADHVIRRAARSGTAIHHARLEMHEKEKWRGKWLVAYSGIADPKRFFDSLRSAGAELAHVYPFGDHHYFNEQDCKELLDRARLMEASLATTAKDYVRLIGTGKPQQELAKATSVVHVNLVFDDRHTVDRIIDQTVDKFERRMSERNTR